MDDSGCLSFGKPQVMSLAQSVLFPCDSGHTQGKPCVLSDLSDTLTFTYYTTVVTFMQSFPYHP